MISSSGGSINDSRDDIRRTFALLVQPGDVVELRSLAAGNKVEAGYFDNLDRLADAAQRCSANRASGVYITINPVNPALLARASNRTVLGLKPATADHDIARRTHLLIDCDPVRPSGISSTDSEHESAIDRCRTIRIWLQCEMHWPDSLLADSGNGGHLVYAIDLPNDDESRLLIEGCLQEVDLLFSDDKVKVDTSVANAARISKVYGTAVRKGDDIPERPHRVSRILEAPEHLRCVSRDQLVALADRAPGRDNDDRGQRTSHSTFDLEDFINKHGIAVATSGPWRDGRKWVLTQCPFNPEHTDRAAYIVQFANGAIAAGCHHDHCRGKGWKELRRHFEPEYDQQARVETHDVTRTVKEREWPRSAGQSAFRGLAGHFVEIAQPHTEADPHALLISFMTAFGNAVRNKPYVSVGATRHAARLFSTLVGRTSKARKGDSWQATHRVVSKAAPDWLARAMGGLSSGEGLIFAVRDPIEKKEPIKEKGRITGYQDVIVDPGVEDKRLLCVEPEFGRVLTVMARQGNTLSHIIRDAWDTGNLQSMTKNSPLKATGAHVSIIGHVTVDELRRELTDVSIANGFANRFLWFAVKRSGSLPEPPPFAGAPLDELANLVGDAIDRASAFGEMSRDPTAKELWISVYEDLAREREGLGGALLARAEAHVLRLSMIYALLDGSSAITVEHLVSAIELWAYIERSIEFIFGDATGNPVADTILEALRQNGQLTRTDISSLFGRHVGSERISHALQLLLRLGKARMDSRETGGRSAEVWTPSGHGLS